MSFKNFDFFVFGLLFQLKSNIGKTFLIQILYRGNYLSLVESNVIIGAFLLPKKVFTEKKNHNKINTFLATLRI